MDHHAPTNDRIRPVPVEAANRSAPRERARRQSIDDLAHSFPAERVPVEPGNRVGARVPVDLCQVPDGPTGPDETVVRTEHTHARSSERVPHVLPKVVELLLPRRITLQ